MIPRLLLKHAQDKVRRLFIKSPVAGHKFDHISRVAAFARQIAQKEGQNVRLAELAGWLHDIGRLREVNQNPGRLIHHELSYQMAAEWFKKDAYFQILSVQEKKEILYAVRYHWNDLANDYFSAAILRDADKLDLWGEEGLKRHFEICRDNERRLRIGIPLEIERAKRLQTRTAKQIVKQSRLLEPFQDFLIRNQDPRRRVLAALSGGVDSAVAAALLIKAGYEVTGAFIKCYTNDSRIGADTDANGRRIFLDSSPIRGGQVGSSPPCEGGDSGVVQRPPLAPPYRGRIIDELSLTSPDASCWIEDRREAMRVAAKLGIKLLTFDFEKEYRRAVVNYLFREYRAGRTPNPDVICNKFIKFPLLLKEAKRRGFDYVATGHYARLGREIRNSKFEIRKSKILNLKLLEAVDKNKDQSYFLHQLKQSWLKDILFPLGNITKSEVRLLAKNMGLPVADREESMGICFVGEVKMKEFLSSRIKSKPGNTLLSSGEIVGRHEGLAFYTIGQRIGIMNHELRIRNANTKPIFVVDKNIKKNQLVVGFDDDPLLYKKEALVKNVHWIAGQSPPLPLNCEVRLRHRQPLQKCRIRNQESGIRAGFEKPQRAVTPGQFAVFYQGEECLGGGLII